MNSPVDLLLLWVYRLQEVPIWVWGIFLAALAFVFWARKRLDAACEAGARVPGPRGLAGADVAREILRLTDMEHVAVARVRGLFEDYYDSDTRTIRLSESVYDESTLTAACFAAHEVGHALQDGRRDAPAPLGLRDAVGFVHRLGIPTWIILVLIGLVLDIRFMLAGGLLLFAALTLIPFVTARLDLDARHRARRAASMATLIDAQTEALQSRVLDAIFWRATAATLPRLQPPAWRRIRPNLQTRGASGEV